MLYLLSGAAASGKKTVARHLTARVTNLVAHHENEIPATTGQGRMANMERWIERALELEPDGMDLLLLAASPLGEVLASPRAPEFAGIAACLLTVTITSAPAASRDAEAIPSGRSAWTRSAGPRGIACTR